MAIDDDDYELMSKTFKILIRPSHRASSFQSFENSYELRIQVNIARYHFVESFKVVVPFRKSIENQTFTFVFALFRKAEKNSDVCR